MPVSSIIDIGTNTIHLLIAQFENGKYKFLVREKFPAKLGEEGTAKNMITPAAMNRGIETIKRFNDLADKYESDSTQAFATAMVRNARNGQDFVRKVSAASGVEINVISGDLEAAYIFRGIKSSAPIDVKEFVVMDIGGGSTEFIYSKHGEIEWKCSFQLGVTNLLENFVHSDPINQSDIIEVSKFLENELAPLWQNVPQGTLMIGASGSFDSFSEMIDHFNNENRYREDENFEISNSDFQELHAKLILSCAAERREMKGLADYRIHTIIPSAILLHTVLKRLKTSRIIRSPFALKEGAFLTHFIDQN